MIMDIYFFIRSYYIISKLFFDTGIDFFPETSSHLSS